MKASWITWLTLLVATAGPARADWPPGELVPFGLMVGHNDGGPGLERLHYARRDAEKVRDVFLELGRLDPDRAWLVVGGDPDEVREAMAAIDQAIARAQAQGQTALLLFYYSGHAKDGNLLFGEQKLAMDELKLWLKKSPAQVRVAFIDACQSGEITRLKGGVLAPSMVAVEHTKGHIIVTSSSASEGSQESDEVGGSFFTHFLVSGLRGDADQSGDGSVSLQEIYEYAYNRTVHRTASTRGGTQHPTYGYEVAGRGEIVLTRTRVVDSGILFPSGLGGSYLVYDLDKHRIAAELNKKEGEERFIALAPGSYAVKKRRARDLLLGQLEVIRGERFVLDDRDLLPVDFEDDSTKGLVVIRERTWQVGYSLRLGAEAFFDAPTRDDLFYDTAQVGLQVEFLGVPSRNLSLAVDLMLAGGQDATTVVLDSGVAQTVDVEFFRFQLGLGLYYHVDWKWVGLYAGPRLTLLIASRSFGPPLQNYPAQTFGSVSPGATGGVVLHLGSWDLFLEGRAHYLYYNVDGNRSLGFGGGYFGVAYRH